MKKTCIWAMLFCFLAGYVSAAVVEVTANVSCRTEGGGYVDTNRTDSSKLSVRASSNGNKSWIKFDQLGMYDLSTLRGATLKIALHEAKAGSQQCDVSAVNDDYLVNIGWAETDITWNNAPGNLTTDLGLLDSTKTAVIETVAFTDGLLGQQFFIDVLDILQADTDGIVQFVLHNSPNLLQWATHDNSVADRQPALYLQFPPEGADYPVPADGLDSVPTDLALLDWDNPEPNLAGDPIYCDVYFGTDPNRLLMDMVTLGNDISSVALTAGNFPSFVPLTNYTQYYWVVDCHDPVKGLVEGEMWSFYTNDNQPPYNVNAGADQATWLDPNALVTLSGSALDDGLPNPPATLTYLWEQTAGPTTAVINSANTAATTVNFTEAGDYTFRLTVSDSQDAVPDSVRIVVGVTPCAASHVFSGALYNDGDINEDCIVDLADLQELIIDDWLNCTDELTNCL